MFVEGAILEKKYVDHARGVGAGSTWWFFLVVHVGYFQINKRKMKETSFFFPKMYFFQDLTLKIIFAVILMAIFIIGISKYIDIRG